MKYIPEEKGAALDSRQAQSGNDDKTHENPFQGAKYRFPNIWAKKSLEFG